MKKVGKIGFLSRYENISSFLGREEILFLKGGWMKDFFPSVYPREAPWPARITSSTRMSCVAITALRRVMGISFFQRGRAKEKEGLVHNILLVIIFSNHEINQIRARRVYLDWRI